MKCRYCNGLKRWHGDSPIPEPIGICDVGLKEHHCGYEGATSPRFSFSCPVYSHKKLVESVEWLLKVLNDKDPKHIRSAKLIIAKGQVEDALKSSAAR